MVLETLAIVAAVFGTYVTASIIVKKILGGGAVGNFTMQMVAGGILAGGLFVYGYVALFGAIAIITLPIYVRIINALIMLALSIYAKRGGLGDETKWAAELFDEQDDKFIEATKTLNKRQLREIGVIAETKEGLRDMTVERYEEHDE